MLIPSHTVFPTPIPHTKAPCIPQKLGTFRTLVEGLEYAALGHNALRFFSGRGLLEETLTYRDLCVRAQETARRLVGQGLVRGDRVGILAVTGPGFMEAFFACQYGGFLACPLPYAQSLGGGAAHRTRLGAFLKSATPKIVLAPEDHVETVRHAVEHTFPGGEIRVFSHDALKTLPASPRPLSPLGANDMAYIQYSSGSTSAPKGILISQGAIVSNTQTTLQHGLSITSEDRAFSWLPLYHDMGLVGFFLTPLMGQVEVDYLSTHAFARRPGLWIERMAKGRCTVAYAPSFGYQLATKRLSSVPPDLDLSHWRVAGIGGDMVHPQVLRDFSKTFGPMGFSQKAFVPSYGMAETTLALTVGTLGRGILVDTVVRASCEREGRAIPADGTTPPRHRREFVACGKPLPGYTLKIVGPDGVPLKEREIGEICVSSPSVMTEYFQNEGATRAAFDGDGFFKTGDLGYWLQGQVILTGRVKDMILHNGKNIWPQDIEWALEEMTPLKSGDVAAFAVEGEDGDDRVVVLAQCRLSCPIERSALHKTVLEKIRELMGFEATVCLVPPKSLPFTSSGKLSRAGAKSSYLSGDMEILSYSSPL